MLTDFILLGADNGRTRAYISLLAEKGMQPTQAVILHTSDPSRAASANPTPLFDNETPAAEAAAQAGIEVTEIRCNDVNDTAVVDHLASLPQANVIFSGYGGAIVRKALFETGKAFLHMHPGRLPDFRGSTTIYHSLLETGRICVTGILLAEQIDHGPVIGWREFEPPADRTQIDMIYDPYVRAVTLCDLLPTYAETPGIAAKAQPDTTGFPCFIIHPVLKHIAILSETPKP